MEFVAARFADLINPDFAVANFAALFSVVLIDLTLSRDNAAAITLAVAALAPPQQGRAIFYGLLIGLLVRIVLASVGRHLLEVDWLLLAGGAVLFWVAWRMWMDVRKVEPVAAPIAGSESRKSFAAALVAVAIADVSASFDSILAVAAVARHNEAIIWVGLVLSALLMAVAASAIARALGKHRWLPILAIALIVLTAARMVWDAGQTLWPSVS